jgi:hypothetical protein
MAFPAFSDLWRDRVRRLPLERADDPAAIRVRKLPRAS